MLFLSNLLKRTIRCGSLTIIDHKGDRHSFGSGEAPHATLRLRDSRLYRKLILQPDLGAGEAYMDGTLTLEEGTHLRDLMSIYYLNQEHFDAHPILKVVNRYNYLFRRWRQSNRLGEAQQNVSHHYDIGNEFYRLFLDENLIYSCAYFRSDDETLEQAQQNKLRLVAAKLHTEPGQSMLDIGCGWGDMALYLARYCDVHVTGVTLSSEQREGAEQRAAEAGLSDRVDFRLIDYREVTGEFDRIVSIGMFEHVGAHHYPEFFKKVKSLLKPDGAMLLHSIGRIGPPVYGSSWYDKYIFPGGYIPSLSEVHSTMEDAGIWVLDSEILRLHYAKTLWHWHERFQASRDKVVAMYDERFARMWEFYLISAEMLFRQYTQMVFQVMIGRKRDAIPLTREYMIEAQRELEAMEQKAKGKSRRKVRLVSSR